MELVVVSKTFGHRWNISVLGTVFLKCKICRDIWIISSWIKGILLYFIIQCVPKQTLILSDLFLRLYALYTKVLERLWTELRHETGIW